MKAIKSILGIALFLGVFTASAQTPEGVKQDEKAKPKKSMSNNKPRRIEDNDRVRPASNVPVKTEATETGSKKEEKAAKAEGKKARKEKVKKVEAKVAAPATLK